MKEVVEKVHKFLSKLVNSFARTVVKKRLWFVIAFSILTIAGLVCMFFVNTNYDSTEYLPNNTQLKQGLSLMYSEFGDNGNCTIMVSNGEKEENKPLTMLNAMQFKQKLIALEGIKDILFLDDVLSILDDYLTDEYPKHQYYESAIILLNVISEESIDGLTNVANTLSVTTINAANLKAYLNAYILLRKTTFENEIATTNYSITTLDEFKEITNKLADGISTMELLQTGIDLNTDMTSSFEEVMDSLKTSINMFYAKGENGNYSALFQITFSSTDYSNLTINTIKEIRTLAKDNNLNVYMAGNAATTYNSIVTTTNTIKYAIVAVGIVVLIILFLFSTSFWEPVLYLIAIAIAVVINMGSNILMPNVSYLTNSVAGILQMALSMDYSIFLLTRFKQEREKTLDPEEAMIKAIKASIRPISASSLTTVASFVAIMFMQYSIGIDMGIVFAKGVILSLLSVFMFLPGMAIYTRKLIDKSTHKSLKLTFGKYSKGLVKARFVLPVVIVLLIVAGIVGQNYISFSYGNEATFGSEGTLIYNDQKAIEGVFGKQNQLAILVNKNVTNKSIIIDDEETTVGLAFTNELGSKDYVLMAQSFDTLYSSGMIDILPEKFVKQFYNDGQYMRIVAYLDLDEESPETNNAIDEIYSILDKYGMKVGNNCYILGGSSSALEIKQIVNLDYKVITWVSIALVALILLFTFRNAILPILLVFLIQGSVWISTSISALTGDVLVFLGYLIVSSIMLGATIDYAILYSSNYIEARHKYSKFDSVKEGMAKSSRAILTSSLILCFAGLVVLFTSSMPAVKVFGQLIYRASLSSLIIVLVFLPCCLVVLDKVIQKTMFRKTVFVDSSIPSLNKESSTDSQIEIEGDNKDE